LEVTKQAALLCSDALYRELFRWAAEQQQSSVVNNSLLVHLGLIKVIQNYSECMEKPMKRISVF
jgi:hypothetical protein